MGAPHIAGSPPALPWYPGSAAALFRFIWVFVLDPKITVFIWPYVWGAGEPWRGAFTNGGFPWCKYRQPPCCAVRFLKGSVEPAWHLDLGGSGVMRNAAGGIWQPPGKAGINSVCREWSKEPPGCGLPTTEQPAPFSATEKTHFLSHYQKIWVKEAIALWEKPLILRSWRHGEFLWKSNVGQIPIMICSYFCKEVGWLVFFLLIFQGTVPLFCRTIVSPSELYLKGHEKHS